MFESLKENHKFIEYINKNSSKRMHCVDLERKYIVVLIS